MRKWITMIIGLLLVGGSAVGFAQYMKSYELDVTMMNTLKPVKMIQAGDLITKEMIQQVSIPTLQHMANAITNPSQIIGKRSIVPIGETEEFLSWKMEEDSLYPKGDEEYIGFKTDVESTVNNMVRRGDRVDVWVEYTRPKMYNAAGQEVSENINSVLVGTKTVYSKLLIKGLRVAYVKDQDGNEITEKEPVLKIPGMPSERDKINSEQYRQIPSGKPSYITFIMTPEQYAVMAEATKEGTIKLGLPSSAVSVGKIVLSGSVTSTTGETGNEKVTETKEGDSPR